MLWVFASVWRRLGIQGYSVAVLPYLYFVIYFRMSICDDPATFLVSEIGKRKERLRHAQVFSLSSLSGVLVEYY